jgi:uncharacterized protein (DUF2126 family)
MSAFSTAEWQSINALGHAVDDDLNRLQVGLTMGGEPTYVSATDLASLQWRYQALGDDKRQLGERLLHRLQQDLAPVGSLLHNGIGKLYPGEPFPRWALGCFWREDGQPLWKHPELLAGSPTAEVTWPVAKAFTEKLAQVLGVSFQSAMVAHDSETLQPVAYVLPILPVETPSGRMWASCPWKFSSDMENMVLGPGSTPAGMRLPLGQLKALAELIAEAQATLQDSPTQVARHSHVVAENGIQVALCVEVRGGQLRVFMPPLMAVRGYVDLLAAVEQVAYALRQPVLLEGYKPPVNQGIQGFQITPDPGVLEVNIHPAGSWAELVDLHSALDRAAVDCGLGTLRYERDGRSIDTGGGAHITLGARQPQESPLFRRPDLLRSFITYWQHHPSLSYLFAGQFVGPTSQSPRIDEAGPDCLEQLEMAFALLQPDTPLPPEVVDHLLHHLLVDVTGSTHRAAFCIDKLYPTNNPAMQLGLLELRGFAMPPDGQMRLLQMLLVRACVAWFWQVPYGQPFKRWGEALHDQFLLPHYIQTDLARVLQDLNQAGYGFEDSWFQPFLDFRCPIYGQVQLADYELELRHALEPWPVLANETDGSGSSRPVDDTTERLQVKLRRLEPPEPLSEAPILVCNGYLVPLHQTDNPGEFVAGVRYRIRSYLWSWITPSLETIAPQQQEKLAQFLRPDSSLRFELFDRDSLKPLGGCLYRVPQPPQDEAPGWPTTAEEAQGRWRDRIISLSPDECDALLKTPPVLGSPTVTLDLRDPRRK